MILQRIATFRVLSTIISPRRPCCFSRTLISNSNSSNNLLFPRRNNNDVVIKPTTTPFALQSRSAHAQPITFEWEEKRKSSWGVSTPEDLEKRINRIRVRFIYNAFELLVHATVILVDINHNIAHNTTIICCPSPIAFIFI